jgi:putative ABC transport system ATP-binding protein
MTTAELTVLGAARARGPVEMIGAVRERLAGRDPLDVVAVVRERLAGGEVSELVGSIRDRPPGRDMVDLMDAMHNRLAAQSRVRFEMRELGVTLEGAAADIFAVAAELHALPGELGMGEVRTFLKLESSGDVLQAPAHTNGIGTTVRPPANGETLPAAEAQPEPLASDRPVAVRIAGLRKTYGEGDTCVEALKGIDLEIREGDFVAVMGPSGSGKSTLMHILGALESASDGSIEIGGVAYGDLGDREQTELRRDRIGFVFQFFNLLKTLSAEENVMLPSLLAGERAGDLRGRARELLEMVGLGERREHLPSQMSGGEQQRVSIARALMRKPALLLADEPTGNLDSKNSAAVLGMLRRLQAEEGHTILMVTHDPVAASRATRVVFLKDGLVAGELPGGDSSRIVERFSALAAGRESD